MKATTLKKSLTVAVVSALAVAYTLALVWTFTYCSTGRDPISAFLAMFSSTSAIGAVATFVGVLVMEAFVQRLDVSAKRVLALRLALLIIPSTLAAAYGFASFPSSGFHTCIAF